MNKEELQEVMKQELEAFKGQLKNFVSASDLQKGFADFKEEMTKRFDEQVKSEDFMSLSEAVKKQGEVLSSMKHQADSRKAFTTLLSENAEQLKEMQQKDGAGKITIKTTTKDILMANVTSNTLAYRENQIGQLYTGAPFIRDLLPVVNLTNNTNNTVRWWEQSAVTGNVTAVAEKRVAGDASVFTWAEKNLTGKRLFAYCKIGIDALRDVDFINGEVRRLIVSEMLLAENTALLSGDGNGNNIKGLKAYATAFDTAIDAANKIDDANLVDFVGLAKTQINLGTKGGAMANYWLAAPRDVDNVRYKKATNGMYMFPNWALGEAVSVGGARLIENALMSSDSFLIGDFNQATLYVWDDVVVEIAQIEDDKKTGMTTIMCYKRENLRVMTDQQKAFVYTDTLSDDIAAISNPTAV